jgi:hypothetical protein
MFLVDSLENSAWKGVLSAPAMPAILLRVLAFVIALSALMVPPDQVLTVASLVANRRAGPQESAPAADSQGASRDP